MLASSRLADSVPPTASGGGGVVELAARAATAVGFSLAELVEPDCPVAVMGAMLSAGTAGAVTVGLTKRGTGAVLLGALTSTCGPSAPQIEGAVPAVHELCSVRLGLPMSRLKVRLSMALGLL